MSTASPHSFVASLKNLRYHCAHGAVAWITGDYYEELPDIMSSGLVPLVTECLEDVDSQLPAAPRWFQERWPDLKTSATRLQHSTQVPAATLAPFLLLLPLTVGVMTDLVTQDERQPNTEFEAVSPAFTAAMLLKLEAIGIERPVSLANWLQTLDYYSSRLAESAAAVIA